MNNVKFANFSALFEINNYGLIKYDEYKQIFAGMYILTILVKDGFAGLAEIKQEVEEDYLDDIRKEVKRALKRKREQEN